MISSAGQPPRTIGEGERWGDRRPSQGRDRGARTLHGPRRLSREAVARAGFEPATPRFSVAGFPRVRNPALAGSNRLCRADPGNLHSETIPHVARRRYPQILEVLGGFGRRDRASSPKQDGGALSAKTVNPIGRATSEVPTRIRGRWLARRRPAAPRAVDHHSRHRPAPRRSERRPGAAARIA